MKSRLKSIQIACEGFVSFFQQEPNAKIHLTATIVVTVLSLLFHLSRFEILLIVFVIGLVWMAELFNTAIERIMDFISAERHPAVKLIKDISAAAVLVTVLVALAAGSIIFLPKILAL